MSAKIFISHSSQDSEMLAALVDLLIKSGIPKENIVATSAPDTGFSVGESLYGNLKSVLLGNDLSVIYLLSENYYSSPICLNEMGAAWIRDIEYQYPILLPGFSFEQVKGVIRDKEKIGISLSSIDSATEQSFDNLVTSLAGRFAIKIDPYVKKRILNEFFAEIRKCGINAFNKENFKMDEPTTWCINDNNHDGCCTLHMQCSKTKTVVAVDFSRTISDLCSVVYSIQQRQWLSHFRANKQLCFRISSDLEVLIAEVEVQYVDMPSRRHRIIVDADNHTYRIPLAQFTTATRAWENVKEVCFLFRKKYIDRKTTVVIENIHLE